MTDIQVIAHKLRFVGTGSIFSADASSTDKLIHRQKEKSIDIFMIRNFTMNGWRH